MATVGIRTSGLTGLAEIVVLSEMRNSRLYRRASIGEQNYQIVGLVGQLEVFGPWRFFYFYLKVNKFYLFMDNGPLKLIFYQGC